jgi:DNA-binding transcriptional LysR family regulator
MQFHRFDLNLLIALDTLLREKNITRAAEKVFVSQPAMSAALHRLRDYFDDPLLVRVGRDHARAGGANVRLDSADQDLSAAVQDAPLHEILLWHKRNDSDPAHIWLRDLLVRLTQEM